MARLRWRDDAVISMRLKDGSYVLGQMLKSPFLCFFAQFRDDDDWPAEAVETAELLFVCAVTRQFLMYSPIEGAPAVRAKRFDSLPDRWIKGFPGSRHVTVWPGTPRERKVLLLEERPGGQLIEGRLYATGTGPWPVIKASIPLDDHPTIDGHEQSVIWTYPLLNERLFLCKQLGRNVDPLKDLMFDRPPRAEYATFIDIIAQHGKPADWGYATEPYTPKRAASRGPMVAKTSGKTASKRKQPRSA